MTPGPRPFELVCEIEPATSPDLKRVRHQIGVLSPVATSFLIPDNHIGRATVSSVAVAHEVEAMGGRSIACLNARDRNLLGFRRDLLTAAAYGVDQFLFIYGDEPQAGSRTSELTVRTMLAEGSLLRAEPHRHPAQCASAWQPACAHFLAGRRTPISSSSRSASISTPCWPGAPQWTSPVPSTPACSSCPASPWPATSPSPASTVPPDLLARLEHDRSAGVEAACDLVLAIRDSGAFDGVHLIPVARYREAAARLEPLLGPRPS